VGPDVPNFTFVPVLSEPDASDAWTRPPGLVHRAVIEDLPDLSAYQVYACGAPVMVESAQRDFTNSTVCRRTSSTPIRSPARRISPIRSAGLARRRSPAARQKSVRCVYTHSSYRILRECSKFTPLFDVACFAAKTPRDAAGSSRISLELNFSARFQTMKPRNSVAFCIFSVSPFFTLLCGAPVMNSNDYPVESLMYITNRPEIVFTHGKGSWL
jgi:hypothetical protein